MARRRSPKCRSYCFTLNNPTVSADELIQLASDTSCIRYLVFQLELCPTTGTPHFQGYVELTTPHRFRFLCENFIQASYRERHGTRVEARVYCMKEESRTAGPWEYGAFNAGGAGTRNDLTQLVEACLTGSLKRVADEHPEMIIRYPRYFDPL